MAPWQEFIVELVKALAWPGTIVFISILLVRNLDIDNFLRNVRIRFKGGRFEVVLEPTIENIPHGREILEERRIPPRR